MDEMQTVAYVPPAPIPAEIVKAICVVQVGLEAVKKSQRNAHGGYNFASADDIYAALTRAMGNAGLACLCMEDALPEIMRVEKDGKTSQWGKFSFSFVLAHISGVTWSDARCRRSLFIPITGPQTFQAAQSYAEKSFLRSMFKIPTGDMDLDSMPQADTEEDRAEASSPKARKSAHSQRKEPGAVELHRKILAAIQSADTPDALREIRATYKDVIDTMPRQWADLVEQDIETRYDVLREHAQ